MITRRTLLGTATAATGTMLFAPRLRAQGQDVLRFASSAGGPRAFDPNMTTQGSDNWAMIQCFEYLVEPPDGDFGKTPDAFEPALATEWTTSDDSRTWVFTLRDGVQFHHGYGEMTGEDVARSFMRAKLDGVSTSSYANIAQAEATGKYEVTVTLTDPDPLFLASTVFSRRVLVISAKAEAERGEAFATEAVGTGPYKLDRYDPEEGMFLSRHEDYWGEPGHIANMEFLYIQDTTARTLALLSGEVDMIEGVRAPGWIPQMQSQMPDLIFDLTVPGSFNTLFFNLTKDPLQNLQVRQAIAHGINKQQIVDALQPLAKMVYTLNPPDYPTGFTEEELPEDLRYEHDPDKAKALLADAGFPNGLTIPVNTSKREDYSTQHLIIQEQLRAIDVNIELNIMDHSAYHASNRENANTLNINSWSLPPVPLFVYSNYAASSANMTPDGTGGANYSHYGVEMEGVDDLLAQMLQATDFDGYVEVGREVELKIQRDLPMLGLPTMSYVVARNPRLDLGYEVTGGDAYWRFNHATFVS
ncbi:peptide/nickel transport system substrate-binding protein [Palleronia aestuarii]|uniref:Peptide/nickel transport system substrate-binding protein n=1 Tax=Palleronia aestuarii TaxID=568105 RepID=A0A2W7NFL3_9RHOB|nr:ABC transporter substrate-binding protein [Palleronia aestuarii]PZX16967.1 peptide/nickel transport system substrate-binding protein [Palleronia aestuarii]